MAKAVLIVNTSKSDASEAYEAVWRRLDEMGARHPAGRISHTAWLDGDVLKVLDVWESEDDLQRFMQSTLGPLLDEFGVKLDGPPSSGEFLQAVTAASAHA